MYKRGGAKLRKLGRGIREIYDQRDNDSEWTIYDNGN